MPATSRQTSPNQTERPPSQRRIERGLREALEILIDPFNQARDPEGWATALTKLRIAFETATEQQLFAPWITRNLGRTKTEVLRARYAEWKRTS